MQTFRIEFDRATCAISLGYPVEPVVLHEIYGSPHIADYPAIMTHIAINGPTCPICRAPISPNPQIHRGLQQQIDQIVNRELLRGTTNTLLMEYHEERTQRLANRILPIPTIYLHGACSRNHTSLESFLERSTLHHQIKIAVWEEEERVRRRLILKFFANTIFISGLAMGTICFIVDSPRTELTLLTSFAIGILASAFLYFTDEEPILRRWNKEEIFAELDWRLSHMERTGVPNHMISAHLILGGDHLRQRLLGHHLNSDHVHD